MLHFLSVRWFIEYQRRQLWATSPAATALLLDGRALDRAIGAIHAAIPGFRAQEGLAVAAFVVELARIRWHDLRLGEAAVGTGQC